MKSFKRIIPGKAILVLGTATIIVSGCMASATRNDVAYLCPQQRNTELAPAHIAARKSPLSPSSDAISAGEKLFQTLADPVACAKCHGTEGDGKGPMASMFNPVPRDFTCTQTMGSIPDGQLFWIIKNGSIGTSMPAFNQLNDDEVWQLVIYLRSFEKQEQ